MIIGIIFVIIMYRALIESLLRRCSFLKCLILPIFLMLGYKRRHNPDLAFEAVVFPTHLRALTRPKA